MRHDGIKTLQKPGIVKKSKNAYEKVWTIDILNKYVHRVKNVALQQVCDILHKINLTRSKPCLTLLNKPSSMKSWQIVLKK
jgi:hypothetical protein